MAPKLSKMQAALQLISDELKRHETAPITEALLLQKWDELREARDVVTQAYNDLRDDIWEMVEKFEMATDVVFKPEGKPRVAVGQKPSSSRDN